MKGESLGEVELIELHKQLQASLLQTENKVFELETLFLEEAATNSSRYSCRWTRQKLGKWKQQNDYQGQRDKEATCTGRPHLFFELHDKRSLQTHG